MPVTTRSQAHQTNLNGPACPSQEDGRSATANDNDPCHPVFYLKDVPPEYFDELAKHANYHAPLVEIKSSILTSALNDLVLNNADPPQSQPFNDHTVDQAYDFFKVILRPADDSNKLASYSTFTFLAVDAACIQSQPWQCIVCSDAPDYGESPNETHLKQIRLPIEKAMQYLCPLEQLNMTPSDISNPDSRPLCTIPPWTMIPIESLPGEDVERFRMATPVEARETKRRGIELMETAGEGAERALDPARRGVLFRTPHSEAKGSAEMYREIAQRVPWSGFGLEFIDNRSSKTKEAE